MTGRLVRTARARADLQDIWEYVARDDPHAADRLIDRLDEVARRLAVHPSMGRATPVYGEGFRSFAVGAYLIFYRPSDDGIEVLRIVHGARDLPRLFGLRHD